MGVYGIVCKDCAYCSVGEIVKITRVDDDGMVEFCTQSLRRAFFKDFWEEFYLGTHIVLISPKDNWLDL